MGKLSKMFFKNHDALSFPNVTLFLMHLLITILTSKRPNRLSCKVSWPYKLDSRLADEISEESSVRYHLTSKQ